MTPPVATYRVQLRPGFGFRAASAIVPYLARLGISTLYCSPILKARTGSTHGYDVTDPTQISPELGGEPGFTDLSVALRTRGMGLLLDIVPNHMAASHENPWWWDVLARGRDSSFARFFDIDWEAGGGTIVLPVLGSSLDEAIAHGEISVTTTGSHAGIRYFDHRVPLAEGTAKDSRDLHALLSRQHYTLVCWREGVRRVNYRRFFDIADLVALRAEEDHVFDATHALILRLVREGHVAGLRVDHIDGLRNPRAYLDRLDRALREASPGAPPFVLVEKILGPGESLRANWKAAGTTGYEFANASTRVLVDPRGFEALERHARAAFNLESWNDTVLASKHEALRTLFEPDLDRTLSALGEPPTAGARDALIATTAALDVYRTYIEDFPSPEDCPRLERALAGAAPPTTDRRSLDDLRRILLADHTASPAERDFIARWQQLSGPAMAKGCEDTALYRYPVLTALNEVGGSATMTGDAVAEFHALNIRTAESHPGTLLATSTHDTKRSEDARARLAALSEIADEWTAAVDRWTTTGAPPAPEAPGISIAPVHQWLLFQAALAIYPPQSEPDHTIAERLAEFLIKAARESKVRTSWLDPDAAYERACRDWVARLFSDTGASLRADLRSLVERTNIAAAVNALALLVLKVASPGVPDFYQGCELWNPTLVDPDNRAPIDFGRRESLLDSLGDDSAASALVPAMLRSWAGGRLKLFATQRSLRWRRDHAALLARGSYEPLATRGRYADRVIAFARSHEGSTVVAVVPRLVLGLTRPGRWPLGPVWADTTVDTADLATGRWRNAFDPANVVPRDRCLAAADLFRTFPGALLSPAHQ